VGALTGAAVGAYKAHTLYKNDMEGAKESFLLSENTRRSLLGTPQLVTDEAKNRFLDDNKEGLLRHARNARMAMIAGSASAGGTIGLKYATDVNANNLAVKRGESTKSGLRRAAGALVSGGAAFILGAGAATSASYTESNAASRDPGYGLNGPYGDPLLFGARRHSYV